MKLIEHIIFADIGNGEKLMINSLNGLMDKINNSVFEIVSMWKNHDKIIPITDMEVALFDKLKLRGYLVNDRNEELKIKEKILKALRLNHSKNKANKSSLTFILTYECNFRCAYCFEGVANCGNIGDNAEQRTSNRTASMTTALIDAALDLVGNDLKTIGLFGGEPLLPKNREAFTYIVSRAPDKSYSIITNGYYLEEFLDILVSINISKIMVTLDGDEETHDSRRYLANGKPTYRRILSGIVQCLKNDIPICVRMNLDTSNYCEANALKKEFLDRFSEYKDLLSFELSPMMEADVHERNEMFLKLYQEDLSYSSEEMQRRNSMLSRFSPIVNTITQNSILRPIHSFCYAHDNGFLVDPYGNIFPCLLSVGVDDLAIGKYYPEVVFKDNSVRNRNIDTIPECKGCKYSLLCGGGCPLRLSDYSNLYRPMCFNIKNEIHNILPTFYKTKKATMANNSTKV